MNQGLHVFLETLDELESLEMQSVLNDCATESGSHRDLETCQCLAFNSRGMHGSRRLDFASC